MPEKEALDKIKAEEDRLKQIKEEEEKLAQEKEALVCNTSNIHFVNAIHHIKLHLSWNLIVQCFVVYLVFVGDI